MVQPQKYCGLALSRAAPLLGFPIFDIAQDMLRLNSLNTQYICANEVIHFL